MSQPPHTSQCHNLRHVRGQCHNHNQIFHSHWAWHLQWSSSLLELCKNLFVKTFLKDSDIFFYTVYGTILHVPRRIQHSKCNLLHQIWTHPYHIWHSSVQIALGSVEQLICTQNFMPHGILGTDCFSMDASIACTELCQISNGWVQIWRSKFHFKGIQFACSCLLK